MNPVTTLISAVTVPAAVVAVAVDHGIFRRASERLDPSIYRGCSDRRSVALTFDDGPGPQTLELLAYLQQEQIRATFFQCGTRVEQYPEITRQLHAAGHEIANHGFSHVRLSPQASPRFHFPSPRLMHRELARTQTLLTSICGQPPRLFRAPYGKRWIGLDAVRHRLGLKAVQWTVIGHDWEWPADRIAAYILARITPGAIICLHDGRDVQETADISEMLKALKTIVPSLRDQGYQFETVSELMRPQPSPAPLPVR